MESAFLRELRARLTASVARAKALTAGLTANQLNWRPAPHQWSIAQCYEHMAVGADAYAMKLRPAIDRARAKGLVASGDVAPPHTFLGRLIIREVEPARQRTMKSPKIFSPSQSAVPVDIIDRFVASHESIGKLLAECDGLDCNRIKLSSPVAVFIRINAADAFTILVYHAERHLNQAERVREARGFPT